MPFKQFLGKGIRESLGIVILSGCVALGVNLARQKSLDLFGSAPLPVESTAIFKPEVAAGVQEISLDEAIDHFRQGSALFVDARSVDDYRSGHIDGAINIPDHIFEEYIGPFMAATSPDTVLITYCEGKGCALSQNLAEKLILAGFDKVYYLRDGWGEWKRNDLPTSRGNY
jgi:rhodanese-related sulfurtransferase